MERGRRHQMSSWERKRIQRNRKHDMRRLRTVKSTISNTLNPAISRLLRSKTRVRRKGKGTVGARRTRRRPGTTTSYASSRPATTADDGGRSAYHGRTPPMVPQRQHSRPASNNSNRLRNGRARSRNRPISAPLERGSRDVAPGATLDAAYEQLQAVVARVTQARSQKEAKYGQPLHPGLSKPPVGAVAAPPPGELFTIEEVLAATQREAGVPVVALPPESPALRQSVTKEQLAEIFAAAAAAAAATADSGPGAMPPPPRAAPLAVPSPRHRRIGLGAGLGGANKKPASPAAAAAARCARRIGSPRAGKAKSGGGGFAGRLAALRSALFPFKKELRKEFKALDEDGFGVITSTEMDLALDRVGCALPPATKKRLLKKFDKDKDGYIDYVAVLAFMAEDDGGVAAGGGGGDGDDDYGRNTQAEAQKRLGTGSASTLRQRLAAAAARAAEQGTAMSLATAFARLDVDRSGLLSMENFWAAVVEMAEVDVSPADREAVDAVWELEDGVVDYKAFLRFLSGDHDQGAFIAQEASSLSPSTSPSRSRSRNPNLAVDIVPPLVPSREPTTHTSPRLQTKTTPMGAAAAPVLSRSPKRRAGAGMPMPSAVSPAVVAAAAAAAMSPRRSGSRSRSTQGGDERVGGKGEDDDGEDDDDDESGEEEYSSDDYDDDDGFEDDEEDC